MASSHCLNPFLSSTHEKISMSTTTISPHLQPKKLPERNELDSSFSLSQETSCDFTMINELDNLSSVIRKLLIDPKASKEASQKDHQLKPLELGSRKVSKKKETSEKSNKSNKSKKEATNLNKRAHKEINEDEDEISSASPQKHVKGEKGRIELTIPNQKEIGSFENDHDQQETNFKPITSKRIISTRTTRAMRKNLVAEEILGDHKADQIKDKENKQSIQSDSLHDHIKPLISNIITDKFSKHKQMDQLSDVSLSTVQSSPQSNAKRFSKIKGKATRKTKPGVESVKTETSLSAPKNLKDKQDLMSNPDPFYDLLRSPRVNVAASKVEKEIKVKDAHELMHVTENQLHVIPQIQSESNMLIEQINPAIDMNSRLIDRIDSFFDTSKSDLPSVIQKTPLGRSHQVGVPSFVLNKRSREINRGQVKQLWNPELINDEKLNEYYQKVETVIEQEIRNQEKAIECLQKYNLNVEKLIENIKKNKFHYQNCLGLEQRVLRNRKNL